MQLTTQQVEDVAESMAREGLAKLSRSGEREGERRSRSDAQSPPRGQSSGCLCGLQAGQDFFPASLLPDLVSLVEDTLASA